MDDIPSELWKINEKLERIAAAIEEINKEGLKVFIWELPRIHVTREE